MKKGKLENGFEFEVNEEVLDDMELIDAMAETETNPLNISVVSRKVLGTEQRKRLYDHLRREDGTVPVEEASQAIVDILEAMGEEGKNS